MARLQMVAREPLARPVMGDLDELTIERARRGDQDACRQLVDAHKSAVFGLLSRMLVPRGRRALVEDLAQETFLRVFRALRGSEWQAQSPAWLRPVYRLPPA